MTVFYARPWLEFGNLYPFSTTSSMSSHSHFQYLPVQVSVPISIISSTGFHTHTYKPSVWFPFTNLLTFNMGCLTCFFTFNYSFHYCKLLYTCAGSCTESYWEQVRVHLLEVGTKWYGNAYWMLLKTGMGKPYWKLLQTDTGTDSRSFLKTNTGSYIGRYFKWVRVTVL